MEGILDEGISSIARVGSRVKVEKLMPFQLRDLEMKFIGARPSRVLQAELEVLESKIALFERQLFQKEKLQLDDVEAVLGMECPDLLESFQAKKEKEGGFIFVGNADVFSSWLAGKDLNIATVANDAKEQKRNENGFAVLDKKEKKKKSKQKNDGEIGDEVLVPVAEQGDRVAARSIDELKELEDPWTFTMRERHVFATFLQEALRQEKMDEVAGVCRRYEEVRARLQASRDQRKVETLRSVRVIGATTSGAADLLNVLELVKPCILICEEAAEILEQHVLASLSTSVQQLVMIGDHKQLRPKLELYELSAEREKRGAIRYDLDVSMFERLLLKRKSVNAVQLTIQHRMRPQIADLIRPEVYSTLLDHDKVKLYPSVKGVSKDVFFWSCAGKEEKDPGLNSYANSEEAKRVVALVGFLCKQGYSKNSITVLSPYVGQLIKLRKLLKQEHSVAVGDLDEEVLQALAEEDVEEEKSHYVEPKALSSHVRIATIDNFQGEESDIIVISLVRSNNTGKIGFLKVQNRINVMLSRAKHGMFLIGNADLLYASRDKFWLSVLNKLEQGNAISPNLPLFCQKHPATRVCVADGLELVAKCPDGGCTLPCNLQLPCGHACRRFCHSDDPEHLSNKCLEPCRRVLDCNHPCCLMCYEKCLCKVLVPVSFKECDHQGEAQCFRAGSAICSEKVNKLFSCNHVCKVICGESKSAVCSAKCGASLGTCSHLCSASCGKCVEGGGHAKCMVPCQRVQPCGHVCGRACHGNQSCPPCEKNCQSHCVHR